MRELAWDERAADGTVAAEEEARERALEALQILDTPPEERFDRVTRLAREVFGVPMAMVSLIDRDRQWAKSRAGVPFTQTPRSDAFCDTAIRRPDTMVVEDAAQDDRFHDNPLVTGEPGLRFYAGHPLRAPGGEPVGTLCILDRRPRRLSEHERRMLEQLAAWVERELSLNEELERATEVQRRLLPRRAPDLPGYELAAVCIPSRAVGGDFYDWYAADGGLEITVADVMGKGMGAALLTATVRAVLRASRRDDVAAAVRHAAASLEPDLEETGTLVTLFHARLTTGDGVLRFVDAGHGLTLVARSGGGAERLTSSDLPLGVLAGGEWSEHATVLRPGDVLVTVSDGVLDLYHGVLADIEAIAARVRASATAQEVVDHIASRARGTTLADDVTAVVIRRLAS